MGLGSGGKARSHQAHDGLYQQTAYCKACHAPAYKTSVIHQRRSLYISKTLASFGVIWSEAMLAIKLLP